MVKIPNSEHASSASDCRNGRPKGYGDVTLDVSLNVLKNLKPPYLSSRHFCRPCVAMLMGEGVFQFVGWLFVVGVSSFFR